MGRTRSEKRLTSTTKANVWEEMGSPQILEFPRSMYKSSAESSQELYKFNKMNGVNKKSSSISFSMSSQPRTPPL